MFQADFLAFGIVTDAHGAFHGYTAYRNGECHGLVACREHDVREAAAVRLQLRAIIGNGGNGRILGPPLHLRGELLAILIHGNVGDACRSRIGKAPRSDFLPINRDLDARNLAA